ncbi:murein biosynthesis integral membrane protein MurJ [Collinsella sp. An268]|uniref:murein biosynthesis integral membrane protein MurJ n=1 Tax=Collinsella sp. An268 TaxID=1965612 RepID=UPI000B37D0BA|nr:murein biosynthesis integral membrane protein MurJ [Collinsella sp. An268]OUO64884.1 lipid II flippase MurJ [Collinsella sp. An268]
MGEVSEGRPRGRHFKTAEAGAAPSAPTAQVPSAAAAPRPDETAIFIAAAARAHAGASDAARRPAPATHLAPQAPVSPGATAGTSPAQGAPAAEDVRAGDAVDAGEDDFASAGDYASVGRSAGLMTGLIIVSRITGFVRTWAMGLAFGVSFIASSYNIANNLPNMLYELVVGGMLVTAFLPVYMEARREGGRVGANAYVSNLLSILLVLLGAVSVAAIVFAPGLIWTQAFMSAGEELDVAVYFFRIFAIQILFYGLGSVFSGVLNAHRDYFWSNFAPVLNNVVVIVSFLLFPVLEPVSSGLAITVVAVGTTLGVFVQMACQIPALGKFGIRPRLRIDLRDPMLKKTLALGVPTVLAAICTLVTASVQNSAALAVQPETGASVAAYARLWYTLPYALISASLNTALYTELARDAAAGDLAGVRRGMADGIAEQFFLLIPFACYLVVFSFPLNMIYCSGKFDVAGVELVSEYLRFLAPSLPLYGVSMLAQKGCSALRDMRPYAAFVLLGALAEMAWALGLGVAAGGGMPQIALSMLASYGVTAAAALIWMRGRLGGLHLKVIMRGVVCGLGLGVLGAAAGAGVLELLQTFVAPLVSFAADGTVTTAPIIQTVAYVALAGIVSLIVTFAPAVIAKLPEAAVLTSLVSRFAGRR